jgi:hypothetical protein
MKSQCLTAEDGGDLSEERKWPFGRDGVAFQVDDKIVEIEE